MLLSLHIHIKRWSARVRHVQREPGVLGKHQISKKCFKKGVITLRIQSKLTTTLQNN